MTATRAPQQERSRVTQQRLLEATVECLVEFGWSGTSTTVVAERAGVSRGAQLHHYPTRTALVLAAVSHLAERRAAEIRAEAAAEIRAAVVAESRAAAAEVDDRAAVTPGDRADDLEHRVDRVIDLLAAAFTGPLFVAALEVWVAGRTDPELRAALVPLEARVGREMHRLAVELLGADETRPGVRETVQATLDLLRGLGVANLLSDDSRRREQLLDVWKRQLVDVIREPAK